MRIVCRAGFALVLVAFGSGCSSSDQAQCVRSGDAGICLRDVPGGGMLEVSGLRPGSTLTVTSAESGTFSLQINEAGSIDGAIGMLHGLGASGELTVSGTTDDDQSLVGTFES